MSDTTVVQRIARLNHNFEGFMAGYPFQILECVVASVSMLDAIPALAAMALL
jgi:hypothetical protein